MHQVVATIQMVSISSVQWRVVETFRCKAHGSPRKQPLDLVG